MLIFAFLLIFLLMGGVVYLASEIQTTNDFSKSWKARLESDLEDLEHRVGKLEGMGVRHDRHPKFEGRDVGSEPK
jgi:hypothetical protein